MIYRTDEETLAARLELVQKRTPTRERIQLPLLHAAERTLRHLARYHRATMRGVRHIPEGAGMLVGNHGLYGYETLIFFWLIRHHTGRYPLGMADHLFFRLPVAKELLPLLGGVPGTRKNAKAALSRGELVVCYPGGASEVFKRRSERYLLRWERSLGFAKVAAETQVPVIPFAGYGVDDTFMVSDARIRLSPSTSRYTAPLMLPIPLPARLRFRIGEPIAPPSPDAGEEELKAFRGRVATEVRSLLLRACHA